jgi:nucleoside-diphosphate-sugar epimerase
VTIIDVRDREEERVRAISPHSYVCCDMRSSQLINHIKKARPDGIVHLAAVSRVIWGEKQPDLCREVNCGGTRNVLNAAAKQSEAPWFIFGSSREVYGEPNLLPVREDSPLAPKNVYGETKVEGELLTRSYGERSGANSLVLRFSNVYGSRFDIMDRVIPRFILAAYARTPLEIHGGSQLFDFTYVEDTVRGICLAVAAASRKDNRMAPGDAYHLLTGHGTTLQEIAWMIGQEVEGGAKVVFKEGRVYDVDRFVGDPAKSDSGLGFRASILPAKGIPMTMSELRGVIHR